MSPLTKVRWVLHLALTKGVFAHFGLGPTKVNCRELFIILEELSQHNVAPSVRPDRHNNNVATVHFANTATQHNNATKHADADGRARFESRQQCHRHDVKRRFECPIWR